MACRGVMGEMAMGSGSEMLKVGLNEREARKKRNKKKKKLCLAFGFVPF